MTSVIVPVFNAPRALEHCVAAMARTLPSQAKVIIIDDASTDTSVTPLLKRVPWEWRVVRNSKNRGFSATVNRGISMAHPDDVIVLNADTVPAGHWFERLERCGQSDPRIASATPFTNNGEIASLPAFCRNNPMPSAPERWAEACLRAGPAEYPDLPTAVGFCMWMRRAALEAVGVFDAEYFGRGYGEENDWSIRAKSNGWRNVLCDDAFVAHAGNQSFGPLGLAPGEDSMRRLLARHPGYLRKVEAFIQADPLASRRRAIIQAYDTMGVPAYEEQS